MTIEPLTAHERVPIEARLDQTLRAYWLERAALHFDDAYAGVPMNKFPEDLRVYEHLLWESRADTVIEVGVQSGASQLWFRDRLRTLAAYGRIDRVRVIGVDVDNSAARDNLARADPSWAEEIHLVDGDITRTTTAEAVRAAVPPAARCFLVDDSAHEYATTTRTLEQLADLVPPGGYVVVEDGCVDIDALRLRADWPRGVLPAIDDWLASDAGSAFQRRRELELYGLTCHPAGFLQRRG